MEIKKEARIAETKTNKKNNNNEGITLIALVVTIVLNCSCLAMVEKREELQKI